MMDEKELVPKRRFKGFVGEWKDIELGSIGSTFSGLSGKTKNDFGHGTAEFVTYMNVFNNTISDINVTEKVVRDDKQTQLEYGDILFTTSSETPNEVGMSSVWLDKRPNVYLNSFCFGFRPTINFDYYYIGYMLRANSFRKQMEILAQGISRYNISKAKVLETVVLLPSVQEQQKIGDFFKLLDERIANQERKIAKVKALKSAYLTEMFPQEGETVPRRRFKGFEGEWIKEKLSNIANYRRGSFPQPYGEDKWYDEINGMPFVQVVDVGKNLKLAKNTKQKISKLAQPSSVYVEKGKVLVTLQGSIGRVAITQYPCFVDRTLLIFESYKLKIDTYYFAYIIQLLFDFEKQKAPGATIKTITIEALSEFIVKIPIYEEQQKIGLFFKNLDDQITAEEKKLKKLKQMKEAYLEEMFV